MTENRESTREIPVTDDVEERFWENVDTGDSDECWEWKMYCDRKGYGQMSINSNTFSVHRVAVKLDGRDPKGSLVLHDCDNETCANPNHLYLGDESDNLKDSWERGRSVNQPPPEARTGEDHHASKLSQEHVVEIRERLEEGESHRSIASDYPVSRVVIGKIYRGELWSHV